MEYPFCALFSCFFLPLLPFSPLCELTRERACVFDFAYFITAEKLWRRRWQHRASLLVVWFASIKSELLLSSSMFNRTTSFITIDIVISFPAVTVPALHRESGLCSDASAICL